MRRRTKAIIATVVSLVVVAAIAGGALYVKGRIDTAITFPTAKLAAPATKTAAPTPKVVPIAGDLNGDGQLDGWEADQLKKASVTYTLADGTGVPIPAGQPLPESVVRDIESQLPVKGAGDYNNPQYAVDLYAVTHRIEPLIGRKIVPVSKGQIDKVGTIGWAVGSPAPPLYFPTAEAALAGANAWVDGRPQYVVVLAPTG